MTKWCREPDSEVPGVTRDAAELLRKAKNLGNIQPQKQDRPRQQNLTPSPKKRPTIVTENSQTIRPTTHPKIVSKSTTIAEKKSELSRVRGQPVINPNIVAPPILQPPSASSNSISSSSKKSPSRPVFDDILDEVHGADFPQARSKTNYNQNKHGGEHLDNAIAGHHAGAGRDKESGDDVRPDTSGRDKANNAPSGDKSREIDHILSSQLPPSSQFPPPQETFNQVVSETTSSSPQSTPATVIQTTTTTRKHRPRKGGYLPTNKSHKKSKKKGYLSQKASYLPSNKNKTPKPKSSKGYLPSSGLSLPASPRSPKLVLLSLPPPRSQKISLDDNFPPPREDIGHNDGVRPDAIVNNHNTNDDTHATAPNQHRVTGGSKQKKNKSRKKGYLPSSRLSPKKTSSVSIRIPDFKDDTDSDRDDASSKRNKKIKNNSSPNKTRKTKPRKSKKIKEEEPHLPRKTDTEQSPFYSLPDSIFDELPEYFRPLPRGLAALIGLSQESQDRRKKY